MNSVVLRAQRNKSFSFEPIHHNWFQFSTDKVHTVVIHILQWRKRTQLSTWHITELKFTKPKCDSRDNVETASLISEQHIQQLTFSLVNPACFPSWRLALYRWNLGLSMVSLWYLYLEIPFRETLIGSRSGPGSTLWSSTKPSLLPGSWQPPLSVQGEGEKAPRRPVNSFSVSIGGAVR